MNISKKILFILSSFERKRTVLLLFMITISALLDTIGVASILPFLTVLTNPEIIETNNILNFMFQISSKFGAETTQDFFIILGIFVILILIFSIIFKAITLYVQTRFVYMCEYRISKRLIEKYLHQPYSWFLSNNSTELGKNILSEVSHLVGTGVKPLIEFIAKSILVIALMILIFSVDPGLVVKIILIFGILYLVIFSFVRKKLDKIGENRLKNNKARFKAVSEAFGAIKEIKTRSLEKIFINNFSNPSKAYSKNIASSIFIAQLPRFILEAIIFGGILIFILLNMTNGNSLNNFLPIISLFSFAAYRMFPAMQQIYVSYTQLAFAAAVTDKLYNDLKDSKEYKKYQVRNDLAFNEAIALNHIHYNYPDSSRTALNDISLTIPFKSSVGLIGSTGSGKTTLIDIILRLLEPKNGTLEIDGKVITDQNRRAWQRSIGYVPQHIYLSYDTIEANIAFGVESENINQDMIRKVSKTANLHQFVVDELPNQYKTIVGERGVRLSGGQVQRIGIARALYFNPKILILDEATSALDSQTEKKVMDAVYKFSKDITIIIVAHRINTIRNCDVIFKIENGKLVYQGTFNEMKN